MPDTEFYTQFHREETMIINVLNKDKFQDLELYKPVNFTYSGVGVAIQVVPLPGKLDHPQYAYRVLNPNDPGTTWHVTREVERVIEEFARAVVTQVAVDHALELRAFPFTER